MRREVREEGKGSKRREETGARKGFRRVEVENEERGSNGRGSRGGCWKEVTRGEGKGSGGGDNRVIIVGEDTGRRGEERGIEEEKEGVVVEERRGKDDKGRRVGDKRIEDD